MTHDVVMAGLVPAIPTSKASPCQLYRDHRDEPGDDEPRVPTRSMPSVSPRRPYRVARSRTGLGMFATKPIRKGDLIIKYWGRRIPNKLADELDNRYLFELNKRWTIDGSTRRNTARYINHSCRPNAETDIKKGEILISAIKNIEPGDEITYDYGKEHFVGFIKPKGCQCVKCREKRRAERAAKRMSKRKSKLNGRARP
jgi:SET domain-containing protein